MFEDQEQQFACCLCEDQGIKRLGISVPAVVVPVLNYPVPLYLRFRGALCHAHTAAFDINKFTDYYGAWYDMAADHLRATRKPATDPFPKVVTLPINVDPPSTEEGHYLKTTELTTPLGYIQWTRQFDFEWETFTVNPNFEPAPKSQCYVQFWKPECLAAKGAHQKLF